MQIVRAVSKPSKDACLASSSRSQEISKRSILLTMALAVTFQSQVFAQGSPIPGGSSSGYARTRSASEVNSFGSANPSAPLPGGTPASYAAPVASQPAHAGHSALPGKRDSIYNSLPLNAEDAKNRLEDLSNRLAVSRPDELKDAIYALSEWLQDVADAHWKMYKTFEKIDSTKAQAAKEKDIGLKFSALKNRAKLLKADLFIKQNRYPEALGPLVEIVTAEPTTPTGQEAYKRLVDMGFSEQVSNVELAKRAQASAK